VLAIFTITIWQILPSPAGNFCQNIYRTEISYRDYSSSSSYSSSWTGILKMRRKRKKIRIFSFDTSFRLCFSSDYIVVDVSMPV